MEIALLTGADVDAFARGLRAVQTTAVIHGFPDAAGLIRATSGPHPWRLVAVPAAALDTIRDLRRADPTAPVIAVVDRGTVEVAAAVSAAGASDLFVVGDHLVDRVRTLLAKLAPLLRLRAENQELRSAEQTRWALLGECEAMIALRETITRVSRIPRPVLIEGERGSGKELVARAIHAASGARGSLVTVNCAAFPDALLESELFGHERGAYTGADRRAPGKFEQADGGTLFLDEIGAMSLPFQQKILRVVEYGDFTRVGGAVSVRTSCRVVAATNADLRARATEGRFLADLYDRLAFEVIAVPPLRERGDDVVLLAQTFLAAFQAEVSGITRWTLSKDAIDALRTCGFPGNVRELKHVIERAAYRPGPPEIGPDDLGLPVSPAAAGFVSQIEALERRLLTDALLRSDGNQAAAARSLGLTYDQFRWYYKRRRTGR
jgi:DNA-binding NtrC family response regulator